MPNTFSKTLNRCSENNPAGPPIKVRNTGRDQVTEIVLPNYCDRRFAGVIWSPVLNQLLLEDPLIRSKQGPQG